MEKSFNRSADLPLVELREICRAVCENQTHIPNKETKEQIRIDAIAPDMVMANLSCDKIPLAELEIGEQVGEGENERNRFVF